MTESKINSDLLKSWETELIRYRKYADQSFSPEEKTDQLRKLLSFTYHAMISKRVPIESSLDLYSSLVEEYSVSIDQQASSGGVDNYSKNILSKIENQRNESQCWKSGLSSANICQLDSAKTFLLKSKDYMEKEQKILEKYEFKQKPSSKGLLSSFTESEKSFTNNHLKSAVDNSLSKPTSSNHSIDPAKSNNESINEHPAFKTAKEKLVLDRKRKNIGSTYHNDKSSEVAKQAFNYGLNKKSLGARRGVSSKFVPPVLNEDQQCSLENQILKNPSFKDRGQNNEFIDERLKNIDPKMVELIENEIMDTGSPVDWNDIAGLEFAKKTIKEIIVWPMLRPDIFYGLRGPPKGLLLFGPPGTGKTLIGKCIACQSKSTFFSISASSLTSKWIGEGEKMVRALFAVACVHEPSVIFIDEIDSLLSKRSETEHEASRRIKTEFLVHLDGVTSGQDSRVLVVGATNRPQELDEAARRRFVKRLYIPLPNFSSRCSIISNLLLKQAHNITENDRQAVSKKTEGYSGADMANLCKEAALGPIRSIPLEEMEKISADQVRPICLEDFYSALLQVRASVSDSDLDTYLDWNKHFGSWDESSVA